MRGLDTPVEARPSDAYWRRVGGDLVHELPGLIAASLAFLAWCLPAGLLGLLGFYLAAAALAPLTLGPGLAGLAVFAGRLARGEAARGWRDSLRGARQHGGAGIVLAALGLGAALAPGLALTMAGRQPLTLWLIALLTAQLAVAVLLVMVAVLALGLVGLYDLRARPALRNALVLALRHPVSTAGLLALGFLVLHVSEILRGGPLVVAPAIVALCAAHHTRRLVEGAGSPPGARPSAPPTTPHTWQETPCRPS